MAEVYAEYEFKVNPVNPGAEILIAELSQLDFESFDETDEGVKAYILASLDKENLLDEVFILNNPEFEITYSVNTIEPVNWNEEWEKNFEPIVIADACAVRAPFHKPFNVQYEIVIEPKMSFGTGHHETTFMMLQFILENTFEGKTVLDMGCGTAVLAILAEMRGASKVDAIDIDDWCVENSEENVLRNHCKYISVKLGDASVLPTSETYDTIIANINRNILLNDMEIYSKGLKMGGELYLSGFYKEDLPIIIECCNKLGLQFVENKEKNNWIAAKFVN